MKDIAHAANLTEAAVLRPLTDHLDRLYPAGAESIVNATRAQDRIQVIAALARGWLDALGEMLPLLGLALFSDRARGERFYREHLYPVLSGAADAAPSTLHGWGCPDVDPEVLILSIFWAHLGIALDQQMRQAPRDPEVLVSAITDLVMYGVSPRDARPVEPGHVRTQ